MGEEEEVEILNGISYKAIKTLKKGINNHWNDNKNNPLCKNITGFELLHIF